DRRYRIELRARCRAGEQVALACGDAADRLHDGVEAAARRPRSDVSEGAQRDEDDARPQSRQSLRREPAVAERARPVALREHISLADEPLQRLESFRLAQIEICCELAVARVVFLEIGRAS